MESLRTIHNKILADIDTTDLSGLNEHLSLVGSGQVMEVFEMADKPNGYYKWLHCYLKRYKPNQVVELGAAAGISTALMATGNPDSKIISVDCDPGAWRWMNRDYINVSKVYGDDLDLGIYGDKYDLENTDFWFFDSLHTKSQLSSELKLYSKFFKKGAILAFDDIHINEGMNEVWESLPYQKLDVSERMHYTGWGIAKV